MSCLLAAAGEQRVERLRTTSAPHAGRGERPAMPRTRRAAPSKTASRRTAAGSHQQGLHKGSCTAGRRTASSAGATCWPSGQLAFDWVLWWCSGAVPSRLSPTPPPRSPLQEWQQDGVPAALAEMQQRRARALQNVHRRRHVPSLARAPSSVLRGAGIALSPACKQDPTWPSAHAPARAVTAGRSCCNSGRRRHQQTPCCMAARARGQPSPAGCMQAEQQAAPLCRGLALAPVPA